MTHPIACIYEATAADINRYKTQYQVWSQFTDIISWSDKVNVTLKTNGGAGLMLYDANDESKYLISVTGINETSSKQVLYHENYKVKIKSDSQYKNIQLLRKGVKMPVEGPVIVSSGAYNYDYEWTYTEADLHEDVTYELTATDKCNGVSFLQEDHKGNVSYEYRRDGKSYNATHSGSLFLANVAYESKINITIPYDDWKPISVTKINVANPDPIPFTYKDGVAKCTVTVPAENHSDYRINWQEPEPIMVDVPDEQGGTQIVQAHHQPKITIMRSGEGNILLKGQCNLYDDQQSIDSYERKFGYEAQNGWVVNAVANCIDPVTYVTVPDVDYLGRGGYIDMIDWGFVVDITPEPGQTVKSLMMGWIVTDKEDQQYIEWEDFLHGDYATYFHDNGDGTYTFSFVGEEMNWWIGDYIVNIAMGPEETAVETGATLNFVRQGGRGHAWIYWHDTDYDYYFDKDGSSTKVIPNEQLTDLQMNVQLKEGESMHVYKDGVDITGQFQQLESPNDFWVELDKESATYTILIEDAPDANPTWTIMQNGGMTGTQVVVTRNGEDETTAVGGSVVTLPIDDEGVEKVTLKVPVGSSVPVTKYQIRLESIAYGTGTLIVQYLMQYCNMDRPTANALVESLPGFIPIYYDSEADAQTIVDVFTSRNAVVEIVPVTSGTQAIANNTPIRVMRNGEEVTFQMDFSDPLYAAYEVPVASLTDETWEVSYDTNHRQTILRTGGTGAVEIGYTYIAEEPITVSADEGLTTIDLPSFNDQHSNFVEFAIEAVENEEVKIYRNGIDVTDVFGEPQSLGGKNWYYISSDSNNTQNDFGFQFRDPAVWEITIGDTDRYDVNGDGSISIADVTKLVNKILGKE